MSALHIDVMPVITNTMANPISRPSRRAPNHATTVGMSDPGFGGGWVRVMTKNTRKNNW